MNLQEMEPTKEQLNELENELEYKRDEGVSFVSGDIVKDRMSRIPYHRLSRHREAIFVKRLKLSYYNEDLSDDLKQLYINYYGEIFPKFKKAYENAEGEEKEKILKRAIEDSTRYRDEFLANNQRLVFKIASRYMSQDRMEDLFQEGMMGMMRAVEKFDLSQKNKFSTYATWWIRQSITRYLADTKTTIRVPVHLVERINKLSRIENQLSQELGREATPDEVMDEMGIGEEQYSLITNARSLVSVASLDVPIGEDDDTLFSDIVPNGETPVADQVENAMCYDLLKKVIDEKLDSRQKKILYMRDGIIDEECGTDGKFYTLAEIGQEFGVTRERIRQIETRTHRSLDHSPEVRQIYSSL